MKHLFRTSVLIVILFLSLFTFVNAQKVPSVSISGEVSTPLSLTKQDILSMPQTTYTSKDRDGKEHQYKGVIVAALLEKAGVTLGSKLRGENLTKYLVVEAADGYEVIYSLPELDPEFSNQVPILAIEKDGQEIPNGEGPFRIIAPNDKRPARWIREVRQIKVLFSK